LLFHALERELALSSVGGAVKAAGRSEEIFERFKAIVESDPVVVIAVRAADTERESFGGAGEHWNFLRLMLRGRCEVAVGKEKRVVAVWSLVGNRDS